MSSSDRVVSDKVLFALIRQGEETSKRVQSIAGTFGEAVQNAVESKHLHKAVFALMNRLNKMDEAKRDDFLASLPVYLEKMDKVWKSGGHVGDLIQQAEDLEREEERARQAAQSDQERDDSVARIETGIKGVPDPDHPDDPDKLTTIADARKKREGKGKIGHAPAPVPMHVHKPARGARGSKADVKAAAERAFKTQDEKLGAAEAESTAEPEAGDGERDPDREYDEAGNTRPRDLGGEDWVDGGALRDEANMGAAEASIGMPGAERPPVH